MLKNIIRLLVYAGAMAAPRHLAISSLCFVLPVLAVLAFSGRAQAQGSYCIQAVGQDERGTRIRLDGQGHACSLFEAVRLHPHAGQDGAKLSRQEQMRSIWAANLVAQADGRYTQPVVKRSCSDPTPKREPGTSAEENAACPGSQAFYYALPNTAFIVPKTLTPTPAEMAEQKKAEAAAQQRREKAAAEAAVRAREESEAFKRVREMEKRVAEAEAKVADAESRLAWVADKEWRAKILPTVFALTVLAAAWAFLMTLAVSAYRFKYRSVTVDNYGYADPLEATKDLAMKLASAREETARTKAEAEAARSRDAERIRKLEAELGGCQTELRATLTLNASVRRENEQHKRTIEVMTATPKSAVPTPREQAVDVLAERCADLDAKYRELDEAHRKLQKEHEELAAAYKEVSEADQEVYQVRDRQARMLMAASADRIQLEEQVEKLQNENAQLREDYGRAQALNADYESSWSSVLRASNRPPAIAMPYAKVTPDDAPTAVRGRTLPIGAAPPAVSAAYPEVTTKDAEPEEVFASLFQELVDMKRQRTIYREGFMQIEGLLSWAPPPEGEDLEQLEERVKRIVAEVFEITQFGPKDRVPGQSEAPASGPLPTATQSDIVRIARMANLLDGQNLDFSVLRRLLSDADSVSVADCLKACVHEWSVRADREAMAYAVQEPYELHDLNRLLCSQLVCGPDISLMVPEGFSEAVDRVHLAYAPAFSRRAMMRSVPPPAMPQASG